MDYKTSSVHTDVLTASLLPRAHTFVLTAVVQMCTVPVPVRTLPSRGVMAARAGSK